MTVREKALSRFGRRVLIAKWWGARNGYRGDKGGWIHHGNRSVCQGWQAFYTKYYQRIWAGLDPEQEGG